MWNEEKYNCRPKFEALQMGERVRRGIARGPFWFEIMWIMVEVCLLKSLILEHPIVQTVARKVSQLASRGLLCSIITCTHFACLPFASTHLFLTLFSSSTSFGSNKPRSEIVTKQV